MTFWKRLGEQLFNWLIDIDEIALYLRQPPLSLSGIACAYNTFFTIGRKASGMYFTPFARVTLSFFLA
jgi:hypothetical protein